MKPLLLMILALSAAAAPAPPPVAADEADVLRRHWKFDGEDADEHFALAVAGAGDTNRNGADDVIVGAPAALEGRGMARVFSGRDRELLLEMQGAQDGDRFGAAVASAGDVNSDGFVDVVVGAPGDDERPGAVFVYDGKDGELLHHFSGEQPGERFGHAVAGLDDVNGDGYSDVGVGAPLAARKKDQEAGRFVVYSGKDGEELWRVDGKRAGAHLGWSIANAGDCNNDSFADLIVGAPHDGKRKTTNEGVARVYDGKQGKELHVFVGAEDDDRFGWVVRGVGDATGDGASDVLVGSLGSKGYARLFDGRKGKQLQHFAGSAEHAYFGSTLGGALPVHREQAGNGGPIIVPDSFDFDADGFADCIIGAPGSDRDVDEPERPVPVVRVYSGKTGDLLGKVAGTSPTDHFGGALAGAGDVNDDSFDDVLVGDDGFGARKGWARLYLGGSP